MQRQDEDRAKLEQASELVSQVEQYKLMEVELKDQLAKVHVACTAAAVVNNDSRDDCDSDIA